MNLLDIFLLLLASILASGMYNCQVFYRKEGTNHWKATIAFFPEEKMKVKNVLGSNAI